ncbi:MAG: adenylate/guanylate cyclase domain-containing protein [Chloroflexi bacterium]|nr:adenylate/guanylate cyclase domain-containing protein [Chloroflexota bacterium]
MIDDQTRQVNSAAAPRAGSAQEQVNRLVEAVNALDTLLQDQLKDLRPRGMGLPRGSLEDVRAMRNYLKTLQTTLQFRQIELRQLRALADTTALITSALDTDTVLNQVMDNAIQLTGAERGYIMLRSTVDGELEFRVARGIDREQLTREDFTVSNTIVKEVMESGMPVLTDNAHSDPRYRERDSIVNHQLRSILAVPLTTGSDVIGVVYCDNRVLTGVFRDHELNLLQAFANQAAVAIRNARLFEAARAQLAEITEMRDLMANIFTSIASGVLSVDGEDRVVTVNRAACALLGLTETDAIGQTLHTLIPQIIERLAVDLQQVQESGVAAATEIEVRLDEGNLRSWNIIMTPLRGSPETIDGVVLLIDDLTETKARAAQLAEVQRYLPLALVQNLRSDALAALGGQEREITILSADVRGFSTFSEKLEPEQVMEVINQYLTAASDSINLFDGVVDKYLGDEVNGLFNTQLNPQDNHAERAVRAALFMLYEVSELHESLPEDHALFYGVGIHTGVAVLGNVGSQERREFTALGDAVETGKWLQKHAKRDEVIISPTTYDQVKDIFVCEPMTPPEAHPTIDVMYLVKGIKRRQ